jgi:hypothetical protein
MSVGRGTESGEARPRYGLAQCCEGRGKRRPAEPPAPKNSRLSASIRAALLGLGHRGENKWVDHCLNEPTRRAHQPDNTRSPVEHYDSPHQWSDIDLEAGVVCLRGSEFVVRTLVTAVILVTLMASVAMPFLTKLFRGWLYPASGGE